MCIVAAGYCVHQTRTKIVVNVLFYGLITVSIWNALSCNKKITRRTTGVKRNHFITKVFIIHLNILIMDFNISIFQYIYLTLSLYLPLFIALSLHCFIFLLLYFFIALSLYCCLYCCISLLLYLCIPISLNSNIYLNSNLSIFQYSNIPIS